VKRAWKYRILFRVSVSALILLIAVSSAAQNPPYERTFRQSKTAVEKVLKQLQPAMNGRLPILDGFATTAERPLSRYRRGYYQSSIQVSSTASGGAVVRVSTKITAWYSDANRPGYQVLTSNGRIEGDLLDQLSEQLMSTPGTVDAKEANLPDVSGSKRDNRATVHSVSARSGAEAEISAPMPQAADKQDVFSSTLKSSLPEPSKLSASPNSDRHLETEVANLEEILKNQAHPKNIVAVKKSGTPVVVKPSLGAKTLFLASTHDEFEMLDFNQDWVHVRISGLSRGWIWRDSLELPDGVPDNPQASMGPAPATDLFQVTREENAPFPGDWAPLRGKYVKIVSVQKVHETSKDAGPTAKLAFAKFVLDRNYGELARSTQQLSGIVLIFDSVDGGMVAATSAALEQWKAGKLSDAALWHQCFFDPPEVFTGSAPSGGN
jgi:hypothetical protein